MTWTVPYTCRTWGGHPNNFMFVQVIFPNLEDELDQLVKVPQHESLVVRVPGFSSKADPLEAADAQLSGLLKDPWDHKIRIVDFGKAVMEAPRYAPGSSQLYICTCNAECDDNLLQCIHHLQMHVWRSGARVVDQYPCPHMIGPQAPDTL